MPTPFPFVANSVLTAAQLNSITELPTRTLTGSGAAVAADSYSRVILNGTSITYTINTSTFSAGQVVEIYNANSTAATIAAGAGVTLNGAAGLTLAQYQTAELYAISATSFVLWKSDVTQSAAGLTYITGASFTSQTTVAFANSVFTSTYDNYLVQLNINAGTRTTFTMQVRDNSGTKNTAAYYGAWQGLGQNGTGGSATTNAATSFNMPQIEAAPYNSFAITVNLPADAAQQTRFHGTAVAMVTTAGLGNINFGGTYYVNEAHTGLVFTFGATSTGSYKVFGYANS